MVDGVELSVPSRATAVRVCDALDSPLTPNVHVAVVPVPGHDMAAGVPLSTDSVAVGWLMSSDAFALTVKLDASPVALLAGEVIAMVGGLFVGGGGVAFSAPAMFSAGSVPPPDRVVVQ